MMPAFLITQNCNMSFSFQKQFWFLAKVGKKNIENAKTEKKKK